MNSLLFTPSIPAIPTCHSIGLSRSAVSSPAIRYPNGILGSQSLRRFLSRLNSQSSERDEEDQGAAQVEDLRVPDEWSEPSKALEESEWLRVTLNKWLDDEYCPESTNVEISKVAAYSYHKSLTERRTDLGEMLLKMLRELESISYQESFHGAFSSANAAINLIAERIEQLAEATSSSN